VGICSFTTIYGALQGASDYAYCGTVTVLIILHYEDVPLWTPRICATYLRRASKDLPYTEGFGDYCWMFDPDVNGAKAGFKWFEIGLGVMIYFCAVSIVFLYMFARPLEWPRSILLRMCPL
jgi:hypothetical protein